MLLLASGEPAVNIVEAIERDDAGREHEQVLFDHVCGSVQFEMRLGSHPQVPKFTIKKEN